MSRTYHINDEMFAFDHDTTYDWSWFEMIASLESESLKYVVGDGISKCWVAAAGVNSYEYKSHRADTKHNSTPQLREKQMEYDFVVCREEKFHVRLHPRWNTNRFPVYNAERHPEPVPVCIGASEHRSIGRWCGNCASTARN